MTSLAFLFIDSPREYLAAVLLIAFVCSASVAALLLILAKWSDQDRPLRVPERIELPREQPIDLEAHRQHHLLLKERHEEEDLRMRRAS